MTPATSLYRFAAAALVGMLSHAVPSAGQEIHLLFAGPREGGSRLGVEQGLDEANRLGRFTGQSYVLAELLAESEVPEKALAVLVADADFDFPAWSARLAPRPIFNLAAPSDALRRLCVANLLHVAPSDGMRTAAEAAWRQRQPESEATAAAWHSAFRKYSARELNERFRRQRGAEMDAAAWAGWAAVKMLAETVARTQSSDPGRVLEYLRDELAFDGVKGVALTFRPTGQLSQPLLLVEDGRLVGEEPPAGQAIADLGAAECDEKP